MPYNTGPLLPMALYSPTRNSNYKKCHNQSITAVGSSRKVTHQVNHRPGSLSRKLIHQNRSPARGGMQQRRFPQRVCDPHPNALDINIPSLFFSRSRWATDGYLQEIKPNCRPYIRTSPIFWLMGLSLQYILSAACFCSRLRAGYKGTMAVS